MKFHQLRPGARFRYRGKILRKVSPLKAASDGDDTQLLVARSAEVVLVDEGGEPLPQRLPDTLPRASVEAALEQFFATCARATTRIDPPLSDIQQAQLAQAFNAAGQDLLAQLAAAE